MHRASKLAEGAERRDFFRVRGRLPFRVRSVDSAEAASLALEINAPRSELDPIQDPGLAIALARIERKVDRILATLDRSSPLPLWEADARDLSISASGISVKTEEGPVQEGPVLIEFVLPESPSRYVQALGREVAVDPPCEDRAFAFEVIAESDREAIVRFSQEMQRAVLRMRIKAS